MDVRIIGVGEFRSFENEEHAGFLRVFGPGGPFDLPVTENQLVTFMRGVFATELEEPEAPPEEQGIPQTRLPESTTSNSPTSAPTFGDDEDFDLGEEEPIRMRSTGTSYLDEHYSPADDL